jgi:ribokinase
MARVVVVGSINMDVVATSPRQPAIGETVLGTDLRYIPGGKGANQAVAAARLGASTALVGNIGADAFGQSLVDFLEHEGVDLAAVDRVEAPTGTALILVLPDSGNAIVVVPGANATLDVADVDRTRLDPGDVVIVQYEIPLVVVEATLARAKRVGARTVLNPAPAAMTSERLLGLADFVVVNQSELAFLASGPLPSTAEEAAALAARLRCRADQVVIATLGADGVVALADDEIVRVAGRHVDAVDSTGCGDAFVGALAAFLCSGSSVPDAARLANLAASICVQRLGAGTSMPSLTELVDAAGPEGGLSLRPGT